MKNINNTIWIIGVNTNLVPRDFIIMSLIVVGVVVISTLISRWLFSFLVTQWSLRYPLFLDGYLMIKAKLKQANKIIRLSRTLSKNYDNLKYIFRNTAKPLFTTTTLMSVGPVLAIGLTVGLPPLYYDLIRDMVNIMDFLIAEVPQVRVLLDNLQVQCLVLGIEIDYSSVSNGWFPESPDGQYTPQEWEALEKTAELYERCTEMESRFARLGNLIQEIHRYSPLHPGSICDDLNVQAAWARARR